MGRVSHPSARRGGALVVAACAALSLSGCQDALLMSDPAPSIAPQGAAVRPGVVYSLPTALLPVTLARRPSAATGSGYAIALEFGAPIVIPDPEHTYTLAYEADSFSADKVAVKTTGDGLLLSISTTSRDESASVAGGVVRLAGELAKAAATAASPGFALAPAVPTLQSAEPPPPAIPFEISLLVDPFDPAMSQKVDDELRAIGVEGVSLSLADRAFPGESRSAQEIRDFCATGACYRRAAPVALQVYDEATQTGMERTTLLPNNGVVGRLDFQRRSFVENHAAAVFDAGMLVEMRYDDPSTAAAAVSAPADLVSSIVAIPASAFGASQAQLDRERQLLASEQALIDQRLQLLESQERFAARQRQIQEAEERTGGGF